MQRNSRITRDPPAVNVIEITELTAVDAGIELLDQDAAPLQPLPLRARRVIVRLGPAFQVPHGIEVLRVDPDGSLRLFDWGFWHFGELSRACKDCFGE